MTLTHQRAISRSQYIKKKSISYNFHISVKQGTHYQGLAQLYFQLNKIPSQLPIDFQYETIKKILVNGKQITQLKQLQKQQGFLLINQDHLKQGSNQVAVHYQNHYNNDGSGCVSFTDVDGKQYIYTQFESYFACRTFPIFDQPDLKAKMRLAVLTPNGWKKVISNQYSLIDMKPYTSQQYLATMSTTHKQLLSQYLLNFTGSMTIFPQTKLLPCYLYAFVAGPYQQLKLKQTYNNIPMSLYCIQSLYKYMEQMAPFVFQITIQSLKFYQQFFNYKYSFNKYDQLFVHQFKWGAMQNAGCVTINDLYIFKEKVSTQKLSKLANTISHQMAHHWFGNLVTMTWWDDVWLNESFADFISHLSMQKFKNNCKTIKYQSSFASFLTRKAWGYAEDQMITTHPIRGPVPNTIVADGIFDGITYSKGAATMKQLCYLIQQQNFGKALNSYFTKYQWSNATLFDFLNQLDKQFKVKQITLDDWRKLWLETSSLNIIQPQWDSTSTATNAKLTVKMSAYTPTHPTLRPHKIKIALFKQDMSIDVIQTLLKPQQINQIQYDGSKGYKAILLNYQDHTFVKNQLDLTSRKFFSDNLDKIDDVLSRTLVWRTFFDMVKDAKLISKDYIQFVLKNIGKQKSDSIFQTQFALVSASISAYTPIPYRKQYADIVFDTLINLIKTTSDQHTNRIVILKNNLAAFAYGDDKRKLLLQWLDGNFQLLKKYPMTIGQQWHAVVEAFKIQGLSLEEKQKLFKNQAEKDNTDTKELKRYACDALKATKQEYLQIYADFKSLEKCKELSITKKKAIREGWHSRKHEQWLLQIKKTFFSDIEEAAKTGLVGDHLQFFVQLQPIDDDLEGTIQGYEGVKLVGSVYDKINKQILKIVDSLKRRQKAYKLWKQTASL